jgi:hypothetical protein
MLSSNVEDIHAHPVMNPKGKNAMIRGIKLKKYPKNANPMSIQGST